MCGTMGVTDSGGIDTSTATGEDKNPTSSENVENLGEEVVEQATDVAEETLEPLEEVAEVYTNIPKDMQNTLETLGGEATGALSNALAIGNSVSNQITTALKKQGMMGGMSGYDESLEDPTLAGRRRRGRRGNEKEVRSGALKIPTASTGIQIPS